MSEEPTAELEDDEFELTDADEELWRQVHPSWVDGKSIAKSAFMPTRKDGGKLSLSRSSKVSAEESHVEYVESLALESIGVMSLTVSEVDGEDVRVIDDSESFSRPFPCPTGHCFADLRDMGSARLKRVGANLRDHAVRRGWVYPIPDEQPVSLPDPDAADGGGEADGGTSSIR